MTLKSGDRFNNWAIVLGQSITRPRHNNRCNSCERQTQRGRHCGCGGNRGPYCDADKGPSHASAPEGVKGQKPVHQSQRASRLSGNKDRCKGPGEGVSWNSSICSTATGRSGLP